jgi:alkylation response protein AidB-like acyl-CoA dehydrogenase
MDFALSDEQEALRDAARSMLQKECPTSLVRAHMTDRAACAPLWRHVSEWVELADGPVVDLCLFLESMGMVAAPGPFLADVLFRSLGLASTGGIGTVALAGREGTWEPNDDPVKAFVLDADLADRIAIVGPGPAVAVVERDAVELRPVETLDTTRRLFEVTPPASSTYEPLDPSLLEGMLHRAWVGVAAELLGTGRRLLDMTLAYAKERVQFDRPIGSFQAVQHKLANMALAWERAASAVYYAAMTLDAGDADRHRAVHVAKAAAGEAARLCAKDGIQIHGGIGYTWEHDLHLFIRRAYASEALFGTTDWHHDRLADLLLA